MLLGQAGVVAARVADLASPAQQGLGSDGRTALAVFPEQYGVVPVRYLEIPPFAIENTYLSPRRHAPLSSAYLCGSGLQLRILLVALL